jgi:hypothetical protein
LKSSLKKPNKLKSSGGSTNITGSSTNTAGCSTNIGSGIGPPGSGLVPFGCGWLLALPWFCVVSPFPRRAGCAVAGCWLRLGGSALARLRWPPFGCTGFGPGAVWLWLAVGFALVLFCFAVSSACRLCPVAFLAVAGCWLRLGGALARLRWPPFGCTGFPAHQILLNLTGPVKFIRFKIKFIRFIKSYKN